MGFLKRSFNIATGVLIRDAVRHWIKERAKEDSKKTAEKEYKKLKEKEEKENKWRSEFDKKANEAQSEYNKSKAKLYMEAMRLTLENVEKYEIKEGVKADTNSTDYPTQKLKYNDTWYLDITAGNINFKWDVKGEILKHKDIWGFKIYNNGILISKTRGKNIFYMLDTTKIDIVKAENLLNGKVVIDNTEEEILKEKIYTYLVEHLNGKDSNLNVTQMCKDLNITEEDAVRNIKELEDEGKVSLKKTAKDKFKSMSFWQLLKRGFIIVFAVALLYSLLS